MSKGWIGVDLDGTLAKYDGWHGPTEIGEPIPAMVERVTKWTAEGKNVRIFTARAAPQGPHGENDPTVVLAIQSWCSKHLGIILPVTCTKDHGMIELWDDRAVSVEPNTGRSKEEISRANTIAAYDRGHEAGIAVGMEKIRKEINNTTNTARREAFEAGMAAGLRKRVDSSSAHGKGYKLGYANGWEKKRSVLARVEELHDELERIIEDLNDETT